MKIKINIDCTPQEARAFLGLPDVGPMQDAMMKELEKRLHEGLKNMTPEALLKTWMPGGVPGWEEAQRQFWSQMTAAAGGGKPKE